MAPLRRNMRSYQRKGFQERQMRQKEGKSMKMCFCLELSTLFFIQSQRVPIQISDLLPFFSHQKYLLSVISLNLQRSKQAYLLVRVFLIPDCLIFWQSCLSTFLVRDKLLNLYKSQSQMQPSLFPSQQRKVMKRRCSSGMTLNLLLMAQNSLTLSTSGSSRKSQILLGLSYLVFIHLKMLCFVKQRDWSWILSSKLPISLMIFRMDSPSLWIIWLPTIFFSLKQIKGCFLADWTSNSRLLGVLCVVLCASLTWEVMIDSLVRRFSIGLLSLFQRTWRVWHRFFDLF